MTNQPAAKRTTIRSPIPTYLSHSYRPGDRNVNLHFHRLFWGNGFAFTVDPKSERLALAQLELMMKQSACFVGVAPFRPEQPTYRTSPFVVYEYGLAVQAQKPRLVFVESGVAGRFFEAEHRCMFERDDLPDVSRIDVRRAIEEFKVRSRPDSQRSIRALGSVGLILPPGGAYEPARGAVVRLLQAAGYGVADVPYQQTNAFDLAMQADLHDFLVIDVGAEEIPDWIHPMLVGRFVPMVRLAHESRVRHAEARLAPVLWGRAIEAVANEGELMMRWSTEQQLVTQLEAEVAKLQGPRRQFRTLDEGTGYFASLGRTIDGSVFVSNAAPENELARDLSRLLDIRNIPFFHYVYRNTIEIGSDWSARLWEKLSSSRLFVPLVTKAYWDSPWCRAEFDIASKLQETGMLSIHPFFLDDPKDCGGPLREVQGGLLAGLARDDKIARVIQDIDDFLTESSPSTEAGSPAWTTTSNPVVDVALITVLDVEYEAVLRHMGGSRPALGTAEHPNRYSWELGEISSPARHRTYRVVLGITGRQGTSGGLLAVRETVQVFRPSYVLLIGIAGGVGDVRKGDVVVSDVICGYVYGKLDGGFQPRHNWTYRTDAAITTAATTMPIRHPRWYAGLIRRGELDVTPPRIHVGTVASGNEVVDDLSDPMFQAVLAAWPHLRGVEMEGLGAAEAIDDAHEHGLRVNFAMVRGISDTPRTDPVAAGQPTPSEERDLWKGVASEAAAALAIQLIRLGWPVPPREH